MIKLLAKIFFFISLVVIEYLATAKVSFETTALSWDKANHCFAFFALFVMLSFAYQDLSQTKKLLALFLFAVQIEIVQYFLPYRSFSLLDIFADAIGLFLGLIFIKILVSKGFFDKINKIL